jgi:hypothetical protein
MILRAGNQAISCLTGDVLHGDLCAAPIDCSDLGIIDPLSEI